MRASLAIHLAILIPLAGCTAKLQSPDLGGLYDRAAQHRGGLRNPVIVIPGILGSKLADADTGQVVWGAFTGKYADPRTPDGARLFGLPMSEGKPLRALRDKLQPTGVLDRVEISLAGLPIELNAYAHILGTLGAGGYRDEELGKAKQVDYGGDHFTCFQFAYDWRRDLAENAADLHEFILERRAYVEAETVKRFGVAKPDVRFDIVAHSMGGLLARYYLRYGAADLPDGPLPSLVTWAGHRYIDKAILVGTPNAGSVKAFMQLVNGVSFAPGFPKYEPALVGTFPSVYQLLPRSRHGAVVDASSSHKPIGDLFDPELWVRSGWGLASPDQDHVLRTLLPDVPDAEDRRRIALDHQRKCLARAAKLAAALDVPADPPDGLGLYIFAGDAIATDAVVSVDSGGGGVSVIARRPGDGTVLRSSALLDERVGQAWSPRLRSPIGWTQAMFLFRDHLGLTSDPAFSDNVLYLLLEAP